MTDFLLVYVIREICTDKLDELYAALKPKGVTVSAMLAKAVALAIQKHPLINAAYKDGKILFHKDVNVAMAVAIDGGLITPVIKKCQDLDLFSISRSWKDLIDRAKGKKLSADEYSSGKRNYRDLIHRIDRNIFWWSLLTTDS